MSNATNNPTNNPTNNHFFNFLNTSLQPTINNNFRRYITNNAKFVKVKELMEDGLINAPSDFLTYQYYAPDPLLSVTPPDDGEYNLTNLKELYETFNPEYLTIVELCKQNTDKQVRLPFFKSIIQTICKNIILFLISRIFPKASFGMTKTLKNKIKSNKNKYKNGINKFNKSKYNVHNNMTQTLMYKLLNNANTMIFKKRNIIEKKIILATELLEKIEYILQNNYIYYTLNENEPNIFDIILDYTELFSYLYDIITDIKEYNLLNKKYITSTCVSRYTEGNSDENCDNIINKVKSTINVRSPFIIYPSFFQPNYYKMILFMNSPFLNFHLFIGRKFSHTNLCYPCESIGHDLLFHAHMYHKLERSVGEYFKLSTQESFPAHFNYMNRILKPLYEYINYYNVPSKISNAKEATNFANAYILFYCIHEYGQIYNLKNFIIEEQSIFADPEHIQLRTITDKYRLNLGDILKNIISLLP